MASQPGSSPTLVYTPKALAQMLSHLRQQSLVALDTESDSLYSYYPKVCLVQISAFSDSAHDGASEIADYLVDPLRLTDLSALGELLASPPVEVVMHAAENDMLLLNRNFGFTFHRVFDTQLAARILGWKQVGLAAILEKQFGVVSDKRMQRTNWGKRPLTPQQIAYAQMDTHSLLPLRTLLIDELRTRRRWDEAQDAFERLIRAHYAGRLPDDRTFWHMKAAREVPLERTGVLEALWLWREQEARRQNRPPFKVVIDAVLVELALRLPTILSDLRMIDGLSDQQIQRYGATLVQTLHDGKQRPLPPPPEYELRPESMLDKVALVRYDALRRWRSETARVRDVTPDIVLTNSTLLAIALRNPHSEAELSAIPDVGVWKANTYSSGILAVIRTPKSQP